MSATATLIEVLKPGAQTQLQDLGRTGWQRFGVPVGGAMDDVAHRVANWLVGNAEDCATLEMVLMGPTLRFTGPARIAVCGADLSPMLQGAPLSMGVAVDVAAGAELSFGRRVAGLRAYLAVQGGFDVPLVMGSRATFIRGGFGGWHGRALKKGDALPVGSASQNRLGSATHETANVDADAEACAVALRTFAVASPAAAPTPVVLRAIAGEHWAAFTDDARAQFHGSIFHIHPQSDRMGYRLQGPALALVAPLELISEGVAFGTVQVPPDGQPIVLMAERQSTGGYPRIAQVATVDLPLLAQLAPQQALHFEAVTLEQAQSLLAERETRLARLRSALLAAAATGAATA